MLAKPQSVLSYIDSHNLILDELIEIIKSKDSNSNTIQVDDFEKTLKYLAFECNIFILR